MPRPLPYFFFTTHSLFFCLSFFFSPVRQVRRRTVFNDVPGIIRDTGRGVSVGEVRCEPAPNEAQRAPPVIFLKDLSEGEKCGVKGQRGRSTAGQRVLDAAKGFLARGRQEGRRSKPLEPVLREFFYVGPWFSSRGRRTRRSARFSSRTVASAISQISEIFRGITNNRGKKSPCRFSTRRFVRLY